MPVPTDEAPGPANADASAPPRRRDPGLVAVLVVALLLGAAYAWWSLQRDRHFITNGYDLGIFDQATWHLARFEAPSSSLREIGNLWGDHLHPVIALWGALRWVWDSRDALLASQAVLVVAAMVPLYLYARDRIAGTRPLGPLVLPWRPRPEGPAAAGAPPGGADRTARVAALAIAVAYGSAWGVQRAIDFDVHELAFAPLPLAGALLAAQRGRWGWYWACALVLLLVKEDVALLVVALGAWLALGGEKRRGAITIVVALAWFVLATRVIIPHFSDGQGFAYWSYDRFGDGPFSALGGLVTHPWRIVTVAIDPGIKVGTMLLLVAPFLVVTPWLTRTAILAVPLFAERFLSDQPVYWGTEYHYSLLPTIALALAAADGAAALRVRAARRAARRAATDGGDAAPRDVGTAEAGTGGGGPGDAAPPDGRAASSAGRGRAFAPRRWWAGLRALDTPRRLVLVATVGGLAAGVLAWPVAYRPDAGPLLNVARLQGPARPYPDAELRRVVDAVPRTGSVAAPQAIEPKLTSSGRPVYLLDMRVASRPPHVTEADTVVLNLLGRNLAPLPGERMKRVMRIVESRIALGSLRVSRYVGNGWAILRAADGASPPADPALRPLPAAEASRALAAVGTWTARSAPLAATCRPSGSTFCPPATIERWRAVTAPMRATLRSVAARSTGVCRDLLARAGAEPDAVLDELAAAAARPDDLRRRTDADLTLRLDRLSAPRRALLVCAPGQIAPPPAPQPVAPSVASDPG